MLEPDYLRKIKNTQAESFVKGLCVNEETLISIKENQLEIENY